MIRLGVVGHRGYSRLPEVLGALQRVAPELDFALLLEAEAARARRRRPPAHAPAGDRRAPHAGRRWHAAARRAVSRRPAGPSPRRQPRPRRLPHELLGAGAGRWAAPVRRRRLPRRAASRARCLRARPGRDRAAPLVCPQRHCAAQGRVRPRRTARRRVGGGGARALRRRRGDRLDADGLDCVQFVGWRARWSSRASIRSS